MHSLGHGRKSKKDQAIYLPPQICFPVSNFKQPVWELWPQWHALDLTQHITAKAENMELPPLCKMHCSEEPLTILTEVQALPEIENSFVTKVTVPLFCLHYKQAPKESCGTQTCPKQSALLQHTWQYVLQTHLQQTQDRSGRCIMGYSLT